jgi:fatty-acyl-CoA synthase
MVAQATVVARPHDKWGEVPVAVIVPREGEVETEEFKEFLKPRLARYKIPKEYHLVESLPMNASGKVVKAEVRKSLGFTR